MRHLSAFASCAALALSLSCGGGHGGSPDGGSPDGGAPDGGGTCVPTSCSALGATCGAPDDGCGHALSCGDCTAPQSCGGGGKANVCGCTAETDAAFCARLGKSCGSVSGNDNCGAARTASCGTCTAPQLCGLGGTPNVCSLFTDARDGKTYGAAQIGDQIWLSRNLEYAADGSLCFDGVGADATRADCGSPAWGRYYNWTTANGGAASTDAVPSGVQGVCPAGWHLPSRAEFDKLASLVATQHGLVGSSGNWPDVSRYLKVKTPSDPLLQWDPLPGGGVVQDDTYGLGWIGAGERPIDGAATAQRQLGFFWTATAGTTADKAIWYVADYASNNVSGLEGYAASNYTVVRCVKN